MEFLKAYENIADLMYTNINAHALQALVHFLDPVLKCFTFNTFDLTPTLEEYQALISIPHFIGSKVYVHDKKINVAKVFIQVYG